jgi:hypothetical protein
MSISYFDDKTIQEFKENLKRGISALGSPEKNKQLLKGEPILLYNIKTNKIAGVAKVAAPPVKRTLLDGRDLYSEDKFNKYEISLISVHMFREELDYTEILIMCGLKNDAITNMTHFQHLSKGGIRKFNVWGVDMEQKKEILKRLHIQINICFR